MDERDILYLLLGRAEHEKFTREQAIVDISNKYNELLMKLKILTEENELANRDAQAMRQRLENLVDMIERTNG